MRAQISSVKNLLEDGKIILYPTDTVWGIGCDATNKQTVKKIYQIKNRTETKNLIILVNSFEMLTQYVSNIPKEITAYLSKIAEPTTVIYNNPKNLAENCIAKDNTIAIRIVKKGFVNELITALNKPIVSTSANISGMPTPLEFNSISNEIKQGVDYIVPYKNELTSNKSSKIIRFAHNKIEILRD